MTTACTAPIDPPADVPRARSTARAVWLVLILSAAVILPRTFLISRAHSASWDDQYHLVRGLAFLRGEKNLNLLYNDPPLGEALLALPLWVTHCTVSSTVSPDHPTHLAPSRDNVLIGQPLSPDTLLLLAALWKSILLLPGIVVVFVWCRALYGAGAGWLAIAMLVFDPTITANIAPAAPDLLGMEGGLIACWLGWRFFEQPSTARLLGAGIGCAAAMLMKHTCVVIPVIFMIYALVARGDLPPASRTWRARLNQLAGIAVIAVVALWMLTLFDFSIPKQFTMLAPGTYSEHWGFVSDVVNPALEHRWPGGIYIGSLFQAIWHGREGHPAMLLGQISEHGWWYYIPVVATYKVPIGYAIILLLGAISLVWRPFAHREWSLLIPPLVLLAFVMGSRISIGFRHALPAYLFLLMLASRLATRMLPRVMAWLAMLASIVQVAMIHPDYVAFVNWPRKQVFRQISDSNLDWGQGLKQVRHWLDAHPQKDRVYVAPFADEDSQMPLYYLGPDVTVLWPGEKLPRSGLLIVSPVRLAGAYDPGRPYRSLWAVKPIAIIGHTMRVYDLDEAGLASRPSIR
jgi:hypothetical protein